MKKVRLKYSIYEFNETLSEVGLRRSHDQEPDSVKGKRKRTDGKPGGPASDAQLEQRERFKLAQAYAREVLEIPLLRARYETMGELEGKGPKGAAVADYMRGNNLLSEN